MFHYKTFHVKTCLDYMYLYVQVRLKTGSPFHGVIHARNSRDSSCLTYGTGEISTFLTINLLTPINHPTFCGVVHDNVSNLNPLGHWLHQGQMGHMGHMLLMNSEFPLKGAGPEIRSCQITKMLPCLIAQDKSIYLYNYRILLSEAFLIPALKFLLYCFSLLHLKLQI